NRAVCEMENARQTRGRPGGNGSRPPRKSVQPPQPERGDGTTPGIDASSSDQLSSRILPHSPLTDHRSPLISELCPLPSIYPVFGIRYPLSAIPPHHRPIFTRINLGR